MCKFISWVEKRGKVYFLTGKQLETEKGKKFLKTISLDDLCGHGTIRAYYGIDEGDGVNKESTNFSSPADFPDKIVEAIKKGEFRGIGTSRQLLTPEAGKVYDEAIAPAWKVYDEAIAPARKVYNEARASAWKVYNEARASAWKVYDEAIAPAWKVYDEAIAPAWKVYDEAIAPAFWDLFAIPENRPEAWR